MIQSNNPTFGLIEVHGEKASAFLQGQLSANIDFSQPNRVLFAVHCNPKGRILCSFILFQYQQSIYLVTLKSIIPKIISHLNRYAVLFRVSLRDQSDAFSLHFGMKKNQDQPAWNWTSELTPHGILISNNQLLLSLNEHITSSFTEITAEEWHGQLLRLGFPWINAHTWEKFLPHELNLQNTPALSFDKGCYTGQEIIARLHYKGRVKMHLRQFLLEDSSFVPNDNLKFYIDADHTSEVFLVDFAKFQNKIVLCLLCNIELEAFHQLYLSDNTVITLDSFHEKK